MRQQGDLRNHTHSTPRSNRRRNRRRTLDFVPRFETLESRVLLCAVDPDMVGELGAMIEPIYWPGTVWNEQITRGEELTPLSEFEGFDYNHPMAPALIEWQQQYNANGGNGGGQTSKAPEPKAPADTTTGKLLYMRVGYTDVTGSPFTTEAVDDLMTEVNTMWESASYGKFKLASWDITPVLQLPHDKKYYQDLGTIPGSNAMMSDAKTEATKLGYVVTDANYWSSLVLMPVDTFDYGGLGATPGAQAWIDGDAFGPSVHAHEMGHNLGLNHAAAWDTKPTDGPVGPGHFLEYGSPFDSMGNISFSEYNAFHRRQLNWLVDSQIQTVTTKGVYRLYALDGGTTSAGRTYVILVKKDAERNYWLEFRQEFTGNSSAMNGVMFNWNPFSGSDNTYTTLIDMHPARQVPMENYSDNGDAFNSSLTVSDDPFIDEDIVSANESDQFVKFDPITVGGDIATGRWIDIDIRFNDGATVSGNVFEDINRDTLKNANEPFKKDVVVYIDVNDNGQKDPNEISKTTNVGGGYEFDSLDEGTHIFRVVPPADWTKTFPAPDFKHVVTLTGEQVVSGRNFGISFNYAPLSLADVYNLPEDGSINVAGSGVLANDSDANGDPITAERVPNTGPINGTLDFFANGTFSYTPVPDFRGSDTFQYRAFDGEKYGNPVLVRMNVVPVNDPPTANPASVDLNEDTPTDITLTGTDLETPTANLLYSITSGPTQGTITPLGGQLFRYVPDLNYQGTDSFQFNVTDNGDLPGSGGGGGNLSSSSVTVNLNVKIYNDTPVALPPNVTEVTEDGSALITLTGSDTETTNPDNLLYAIDLQPLHGTLTQVSNREYLYTPNPDYNGADSFTFKVTDRGDPDDSHSNPGNLTSTPALVSIVVNPVNDAPTAIPTNANVSEDGFVEILLGGSDKETTDASSLTYEITQQPENGTLVQLLGRRFRYNPYPEFSGDDSFFFRVVDSGDPAGAGNGNNLQSSPVRVDLTVSAVNDRPTAIAQPSVSLNEDGSVEITLAGTDRETPAEDLNFSIFTQPTNGTLTPLTPGTSRYRYTPFANFNGNDSFKFKAIDNGDAGTGALESSAATVNLTINRVNDKPTAHPGTAIVNEDGSIEILLGGSDLETPADSLVYTVFPGTPPLPGNIWNTEHGTLKRTDNRKYLYTPALNYNGPDSFTFLVTDTGDPTGSQYQVLNSDPASVAITVVPANDRPTATGQNAAVQEDGSVLITLVGSDLESTFDGLTFLITDSTDQGTLVQQPGSNNVFLYTPNPNYSGFDTFTFNVLDTGDPAGTPGNTLTSIPASVSISISPVNDTPVATPQNLQLNEDSSIPILLAGSDLETNANDLIFTIESFPDPVNEGSLTSISGNKFWLFTPVPNFAGLVDFTFSVRDTGEPLGTPGNAIASAPATITLDVVQINDRPTLGTVGTLPGGFEDTTRVITHAELAGVSNIFDVESAQPAFRLGTISNGTLLINGLPAVPGVSLLSPGGSWSWTPAPNVSGLLNAFTLQAFDGQLASASPVQVRVDVAPVNDAPTLTSVNTISGPVISPFLEDSPINITFSQLAIAANDADIEGGSLSFLVQSVLSGTLTKAGVPVTPGTVFSSGQTLVWTPGLNANGLLGAFTISAFDGDLASTPAVPVNVNVLPVNDAPTIGSLTAGPNPFVIGDFVTLNADNLTDIDGTIQSVYFYFDSNHNNQFEPGLDLPLGNDSDPTNGWSLNFNTAALTLGSTRFFARARDNGNGNGTGQLFSLVPAFDDAVGHQVILPTGKKQRIVIVDEDGDKITAKLKGPGVLKMVVSQLGPVVVENLLVEGSTTKSKLFITAKGPARDAELGGIFVDGSLKLLKGPTTDVLGGVDIVGGASTIVLGTAGSITQQGQGITPLNTALTLADTTGTTVDSALLFRHVKGPHWHELDNLLSTPLGIVAPPVGSSAIGTGLSGLLDDGVDLLAAA